MINELKTKNEFLKIKNYIELAKNILVITHQDPDGDAIGSTTAIIEFLKNANKNYLAFCVNNVPNKFLFLKNTEKITSNLKILNNNWFDLIIVLDCSNIDFTGIKNHLDKIIRKKDAKLINIDHHISNKNYGDINLVDNLSCSTTAILYNFFKQIEIAINKEMATSLLVGILTDTENFTNSATTSKSFKIASKLIAISGKYNYIIKQVYQDKNKKKLQIWGKILSRLIKNDKLNIAYSVILIEDGLEEDRDLTEGMSNFFNKLSGVKIVMVLKEKNDDNIKISLRSTDKKINVLPFAQFFNGGGHNKAAGFTIQGRLEKTGNYWQII